MTGCLKLLFVGVNLSILLFGYQSPALAHGFGERYDLPLPLWFYVIGGGSVVLSSFFAIGFFVQKREISSHYPTGKFLLKLNDSKRIQRSVLRIFGLISVGILILVILSGFIGTQIPTENFSPTFIWIIWWIGLAYLTAFLGNFWAFLNPWWVLFGFFEDIFRLVSRGRGISLKVRYPSRIGCWPAIILYLSFAWIELVYPESAIPIRLSQFILFYSGITLIGMFIFGKDVWVRNGDPFSLCFGLIGKMAPLEVRVFESQICQECGLQCQRSDSLCVNCSSCYFRASPVDRKILLRPFGAGLSQNDKVSVPLMIFVIVVLASVSFDGFTSTLLWQFVFSELYSVIPNVTVAGTLGLVGCSVFFLAVYLFFSTLMAAATSWRIPVLAVSTAFIYSLIPIALAYHLAHYFSYLLIQGQLIFPLVSDPFGFGWDLFNSGDFVINIGIVNAKFAWITALISIICGHVVAIYVAHVIAIQVFTEKVQALRSQYPMVVLMVGYTMLSLWTLAQPLVELK